MMGNDLKFIIGILLAILGAGMFLGGVGGFAVSFLIKMFPEFRLMCAVQIPVGLCIILTGGFLIRSARRKG